MALLPYCRPGILVAAIILLASQSEVARHSFGGRVTETRIEWRTPLREDIRNTFVVADALWFNIVAEQGYARQKFDASIQRDWAFLPGWPLVLRLVYLCGDPGWTSVAAATTCFGAGLILFFRIGVARGLTRAEAAGTAAFLAFWPGSYFFTVPTSESLFLLLSAGSVFLALKRQWLGAALLAGCASGTRITGVLLILLLIVLHRECERRWWSRGLLWLALAPCGLLAFMVFLGRITGNRWRSPIFSRCGTGGLRFPINRSSPRSAAGRC